jgi:hypothetical protein
MLRFLTICFALILPVQCWAVVGSVQTIIVCVPSAFAQAPCPAGQAISTMSAYVLDPAQSAVYAASVAPFDYVAGAEFWSLAFGSIMFMYFTAHGIGLVLKMVKKG